MLDFVQVVSDHVGRDAASRRGRAALDRGGGPRVGHQRHQARKPARPRTSTSSSSSRPGPRRRPTELVIVVQDQGEGFDPEGLADPLAPENLLKSSGRGIFFMRSFMDDVQLRQAPEGGMEVRMVKRLTPILTGPPAPDDSRSAVPRHGNRGRPARRRDPDGAFRPRSCASTRRARSISSPKSISPSSGCSGACIAERFPDHTSARRRTGARKPAAARLGLLLGVRSDRRHDELRARAADVLRVARRWRSTAASRSAAVYDPTRQELFTAERGGGAFLNGAPLRVSDARHADGRAAGHRVPVRRARGRRRGGRAVRRVPRPGAGRAAARIGGARPLLCRRRAHGRLLGTEPQALGHGRRPACSWRRRAASCRAPTARRLSCEAGTCWPRRRACRRRCSRHQGVPGRACSKPDALIPVQDIRRPGAAEFLDSPAATAWHQMCERCRQVR